MKCCRCGVRDAVSKALCAHCRAVIARDFEASQRSAVVETKLVRQVRAKSREGWGNKSIATFLNVPRSIVQAEVERMRAGAGRHQLGRKRRKSSEASS